MCMKLAQCFYIIVSKYLRKFGADLVVWPDIRQVIRIGFFVRNSNALGGGLLSPSALFDMNTLLGAYGLHEFDEMVGWTEEE